MGPQISPQVCARKWSTGSRISSTYQAADSALYALSLANITFLRWFQVINFSTYPFRTTTGRPSFHTVSFEVDTYESLVKGVIMARSKRNDEVLFASKSQRMCTPLTRFPHSGKPIYPAFVRRSSFLLSYMPNTHRRGQKVTEPSGFESAARPPAPFRDWAPSTLLRKWIWPTLRACVIHN